MVKNPPASADAGSIPRWGTSPGGGHGNSFQYACLENPHGLRNLVGYSPWGLKELDMTETTEHTLLLTSELRSSDQICTDLLRISCARWDGLTVSTPSASRL